MSVNSYEKCNAQEAVARAQAIVGKGGHYFLGEGDYNVGKPGNPPGLDLPWTGEGGSDCAGFAICWAWKLRRHRPGFNSGPWASVSDDVNCNSAYEDGLHKQELFVAVKPGEQVAPGDLLLYPTFVLGGKRFIGHVGLIESVPDGFTYGDWRRLSILQCHGPNGYTPGVVRTDGSIWAHHDMVWPKEAHRAHVVRPKERI